jgi:lactoylglutathione lyase
MNFKYDFTRLLVVNFKECYLFYRDVMGFKSTYGTEDDVYADFDTGKVTLALFDRLAMSKAVGVSDLPINAPSQDKFCLVFAVENVDAVCQKLKAKGISLSGDPEDHPDWGIRSGYLRDPDGTLIELYQPLEKPS